MGYPTIFSRPITDHEFSLMKEYAPIEIMNTLGNTDENVRDGLYDSELYDLLMRSYSENIPCVYGHYWWQYGYGASNPAWQNGQSCVREIRGYRGLYVEVPKYYDTFRIGNYSRRVVGSRKDLRRWMGKRYFSLSNEQLERISEFFRENPDGVITFG